MVVPWLSPSTCLSPELLSHGPPPALTPPEWTSRATGSPLEVSLGPSHQGINEESSPSPAASSLPLSTDTDTHIMDMQLSDLFFQDCQTPLDFDFDSISDAGYHSACDGLSPTSSVDSSCSSPSGLHSGGCGWSSPLSQIWSSRPGQDMAEGTDLSRHTAVQIQNPARSGNQEQMEGFQQQEQAQTSNIQPVQLPAVPSLQQQRAVLPIQEQSLASQPQDKRHRSRCRSKNPTRKRQSASEKEKLRMRDLTKALNHLRTYLPDSVAPAGQTLTKIQTLRLVIRYIAHLSEELQVSHVDTGVRMERGMEVRQSPDQARGQTYPQVDSPAQHFQYSQYQSATHWSHHGDQYTHCFEQDALLQQNQLTNGLTSASQQDMISYEQENLVQIRHGFYYPHQL